MSNLDYNEADALATEAAEPALIGSQKRGLAAEFGNYKLSKQLATPVTIANEADFAALQPGQVFIDPEGQQRVKPYVVKNDGDFDALPEGVDFYGPDGELRKKPKYEGIGFTAQTLYSMAVTPREKRKILEKHYPGRVQGDGEDLYVIDEQGVYRKPGRLGAAPDTMGMISGNIAPVGLGALGSMLGATAGSALVPGPGTFGGGMAGGATGGIAGQRFNDIILTLNGVYDRTPTENLVNDVIGVGASAAGDVVGRGVAALVPSMKAGVSKAGQIAPDIANKFLGTSEDDLARALRITELGEGERPGAFGLTGSSTGVGISTFAPGAPYLQMLQETMHEKFTTEGTRRMAAERAYQKEVEPFVRSMAAGKKFENVDDYIGPPTPQHVQNKVDEITGDLLNPQAAVSGREAGEKLQLAAMQRSQQLDAEFEAALAAQRRAAELGLGPEMAQRDRISQIAQERHRVASQLIREGLDLVDRQADQAVATAAAGSNTGGLWEQVGQRILAAKQALTQRYRANSEAAYETVPNNARIRVDRLTENAEEFMAELPEEFAARYPAVVRRIRSLARRPNPEYQAADEATGAPAVGERFLPPEPMSLSELHQLRTDLREASDYHNLPSSFRNFATKKFAHDVDQVIHGVRDAPQFNTAIRLLDDNDAWYAHERPVFNARELQTTVRALEAGHMADPEMLYKALVRDGKSDLIARTEQIVGPQLWNGVRGAQQQTWLQAARKGQADNSVDAVKFADEVLDANRLGTLVAVQGPMRAQELLTQAHQIKALEGTLPVTFRQGDTALDIFRQANVAVREADELAKRDPLAALQKELRNREGRARGEHQTARGKDELKFLADKSFGEGRAVDRILGNEDLILATAHRFGETSPEFNALRQVWIERVFKGNTNPGKGLGKATPEIQRLMMGVDVDTARKIAEDMNFIMGSKALRGGGEDGGQSIAAATKLTHPLGRLGSGTVGKIPGVNAAARASYQKYYELIDKVLSSPSTQRFLQKSYQGSAEHRENIRQILTQHIQKGGAMGAGGGQGLYQMGGENPTLSDQLNAQQAPDGKFYVPDPQRPGKFLEVRP